MENEDEISLNYFEAVESQNEINNKCDEKDLR